MFSWQRIKPAARERETRDGNSFVKMRLENKRVNHSKRMWVSSGSRSTYNTQVHKRDLPAYLWIGIISHHIDQLLTFWHNFCSKPKNFLITLWISQWVTVNSPALPNYEKSPDGLWLPISSILLVWKTLYFTTPLRLTQLRNYWKKYFGDVISFKSAKCRSNWAFVFFFPVSRGGGRGRGERGGVVGRGEGG